MKNFFLQKVVRYWHKLFQGHGGVVVPRGIQGADVALGNIISGHGGDGLEMDMLAFSNVSDSMIL